MNQLPEILFDARWLRTGIGRYILTLLQELKQNLPHLRLTCITLPEHVDTIAPLCDRVISLSCGIYTLSEQVALPFIRDRASVFCAPHYNIPVLRQGQLVTTVHDITHLLFSQYERRLSSRLYARPMLRIVGTRASHVVTPSDYTRRMLIERLDIPPQKISAIPCALGEIFRLHDRAKAAYAVEHTFKVTGPFMLYVGTAAPHKNVNGLLQAYHHLRSRRRDIPALVMVMADGPSSAYIDERLQSLLSQPGVCRLSAVSDASLVSLYSSATATILPSFEEGFGLPVAESMACGTPVLCSNAGSLPEVAGAAAMYFSPHSIEEMICTIERFLDSPAEHLDMVKAGLDRARLYSPSRAAEGYADVLRSVMEQQI